MKKEYYNARASVVGRRSSVVGRAVCVVDEDANAMTTESSDRARRGVRVAVRARPTREGDGGAVKVSHAREETRARSASTVVTRTAEEREEEYRLARERIFGVDGEGAGEEDEGRESGPADAPARASASVSTSVASSSSGGESGRGMSADAPAFTPRGGKATMKNKLMDLFDPDFRRAPRVAPVMAPVAPWPVGPPPMPPMPPPMPPRFAAPPRETQERLAHVPPLGTPAPPPVGHPPPANRPPSR